MGRKALETTIDSQTLPDSTASAISADLQAAAALPAMLAAIEQDTQALAKRLGYDGPLTPDLLEEGARESLARINFEIFSVGARLLLIKAQCAHGDFIERLERLGVERTMAARMMQATRKFPNVATSQHLASLGKSKIFELVVLDDDEADAFANGDEVRGITQDDAALMSVSELRAALRKERAEKEAEIAKKDSDISGSLAAKDRIIAEGKKRIAELVEEKNRREAMTDGERDVELQRELASATLLAVGSLIPLRKAIDAIRSLDHCSQGLYVAMQGGIHQVLTEAETIASDYGISLDIGLPAIVGADEEFDDPNAGEVFDAAPLVQ